MIAASTWVRSSWYGQPSAAKVAASSATAGRSPAAIAAARSTIAAVIGLSRVARRARATRSLASSHRASTAASAQTAAYHGRYIVWPACHHVTAIVDVDRQPIQRDRDIPEVELDERVERRLPRKSARRWLPAEEVVGDLHPFGAAGVVTEDAVHHRHGIGTLGEVRHDRPTVTLPARPEA